MDKLITIIIPIYNTEKYLARCLDSVLIQLHRNLEILLVDDESTDQSVAIAMQYAASDSRIRVLQPPHGGLSAARNAGLAVAKGDYIGFVDGDDWIAPDMFSRMLAACEESGADMAVCRYTQWSETESTEKPEQLTVDEKKPTDKVKLLSKKEALREYLSDQSECIIYNSAWSKLYKRELALQFRFPEGRTSEDIMYTTQTMAAANTVAYVDSALYNYVVNRSGSIMNGAGFTRRMKHELPFWEEQIVYLASWGLPEASKMAAYYYYRRLLYYYLEMADGKDKQTRDYADFIADKMLSKKAQILSLYEESSWNTAGDLKRMKLFLLSPKGFLLVSKLFEKIILPLRQKMR